MKNINSNPIEDKEKEIRLKYGAYLSSNRICTRLPYGIIIKEKTGIGATTVELKDNTRPTILVFPNKALAATKAISASIKYKKTIYYAGSDVNGAEDNLHKLDFNNFERLIQSKEAFKIAMVADTFVKYYNIFKDKIDNHPSLFILFDEADVYQSDSSYRNNLEKCMRIFIELPEHKRCLLTATSQSYAATEFEGISTTKIIVEDAPKEEINLFHSKIHPLSTLVFLLNKHEFSKGKILVALNSITACIYVAMKIENLNKKYNNEIGILCSDSRKPYIPEAYKVEFKNGKLDRHVTFITTSYFSGVDINSSANVIVCSYSEPGNDHAFLTMHRIKQAMGRIRKEVKSRSLILKTDPDYPENDEFIKMHIQEYQDFVLKACQRWESLRNPLKIDSYKIEIQRKAIIEAFSYPNARNKGQISLVGYDENKWQKNLMGIDSLIMDHEATTLIYRSLDSCRNYFIQNGYTLNIKEIQSEEAFDNELYTKAIDIQKTIQKEEFIDAIKNPTSNNTRPEILQVKYIVNMITETGIDIYDEGKLIQYMNNNKQMQNMLKKTYNKLFLSSFCVEAFIDYFSSNKIVTLSDINNATEIILNKQYTNGLHIPNINNFEFETHNSVLEIFSGSWKEPEEFYGIDTSYNIRHFEWINCKTPKSILEKFLTGVNKYADKQSKKQENNQKATFI